MHSLKIAPLATALAPVASAWDATLDAGPGKSNSLPSKTIAAAHDGDTVLIALGTYFDCTIVGQNNLTIAGSGPDSGAGLAGKPCATMAFLAFDGRDCVVRNPALIRVHVPNGNGVGIRAEAHHLTVDHVSFINNQDCILATPEPGSTIIVRDSALDRNGACDRACAHGIYINSLKLLHAAMRGRPRRQVTGHSGAQVVVSG